MRNRTIRPVLGAGAAIALAFTLALPASAGQLSGYRACSSSQTVGLGSGTYSTAIHTHKYTPDAGSAVSYTSSPRTTWSTIGPFKNASWTVSNGISEAMRSGSSACIYLP